jgi:hypothetical protein
MKAPFSAIFIGATLGFISLIPLQALTNSQAKAKCADAPEANTLVTVRAFAGTAKYCVDNRYLTPTQVARYGPAF